MKNLVTGLLLCVILFSCKKEPKDLFSPPELARGKKYGIQFNLTDFTPEILGIKNQQISEVPLKDKVGDLYYLAFNEEGKEVSRIRQKSTGSTSVYGYDELGFISDAFNPGAWPFGTFTDSLSAGDYTIIIIACQKDIGINTYETGGASVSPFSSAYFSYTYVMMENRSRATDTFFKKFQLKVDEDKDLNQKVELDRIVAKAEINILDAKPDVGYRFSFINEYLGFRFANGTFVDGAEDAELGAVGIIRDNKIFSAFILNTDPNNPIDIVIEAFQGSNRVPIAKKIVENVPFIKNKRTVLTGNLHSTTTSALGFSVTVCDEFDKDTINVSF